MNDPNDLKNREQRWRDDMLGEIARSVAQIAGELKQLNKTMRALAGVKKTRKPLAK